MRIGGAPEHVAHAARSQRPPAPTEVAPSPDATSDEPARVKGGSDTPFTHALHQGNGKKVGIHRRLEAQEVATLQQEAGVAPPATEPTTESPATVVAPDAPTEAVTPPAAEAVEEPVVAPETPEPDVVLEAPIASDSAPVTSVVAPDVLTVETPDVFSDPFDVVDVLDPEPTTEA